MRRANHPSISQPGRVTDDGVTVTVSGWTLGLCATGCVCHRHPTNGHLYLDEGTDGHLGLRSYKPGGCGCCTPWSVGELADVVRDLLDIAALMPQPPETAS